MKRHPSLVQLSRDHHGALILARLLQKDAPPYKGLPPDTLGKVAYAQKFYRDELVKHFEQEEKVLNLVTGVNVELDLLVQTIFHEHRQLHVLFKSIADPPGTPAQLDELGKALEMHVRKEERKLFPLIEETCSEEMMTAVEQTFLSD